MRECVSSSYTVLTCVVELQVSQLQSMLGDSVNNLVKHYYKPEKEVSLHLYHILVRSSPNLDKILNF